MRALVIHHGSGHSIDVIGVPDSTPVLDLEIQTQRLDAAGVDVELVSIQSPASVEDLVSEVDRYVHDADPEDDGEHDEDDDSDDEEQLACEECDVGPDGVISLLHDEDCSLHPSNVS